MKEKIDDRQNETRRAGGDEKGAGGRMGIGEGVPGVI